MNKRQMQLEVCKALLDQDRRCGYVQISDDEIAVTTDGYACYVFTKNECVFDLSKMRSFEVKGLFNPNSADKEIKTTNRLILDYGKTLEIYEAENFTVYIDVKIAKRFSGFHFFCFGERQRILVKDDFGRIIGVFLPVRYISKTKGTEV